MAKDSAHSLDAQHWASKFDGHVRPCLAIDNQGQITWAECAKAIKAMANGKAPGRDGLISEWYKMCIEKELEMAKVASTQGVSHGASIEVESLNALLASEPRTSMGKVIF